MRTERTSSILSATFRAAITRKLHTPGWLRFPWAHQRDLVWVQLQICFDGNLLGVQPGYTLDGQAAHAIGPVWPGVMHLCNAQISATSHYSPAAMWISQLGNQAAKVLHI